MISSLLRDQRIEQKFSHYLSNGNIYRTVLFTNQHYLPNSTMANSNDSLDKTIAIDDERICEQFFS
jgi:hypothetical protein